MLRISCACILYILYMPSTNEHVFIGSLTHDACECFSPALTHTLYTCWCFSPMGCVYKWLEFDLDSMHAAVLWFRVSLVSMLNFTLNLRIERYCNFFFLTKHVRSNFLCKTVALTVCWRLCCVCVLSHSFPCSFRPHRAPSPNLPHHSVSASPVSQGYKHSLRPPFYLPKYLHVFYALQKMVHLSKRQSLEY